MPRGQLRHDQHPRGRSGSREGEGRDRRRPAAGDSSAPWGIRAETDAPDGVRSSAYSASGRRPASSPAASPRYSSRRHSAHSANRPAARDGEWTAYAGGAHGRRSSPLDQITKANVKDLRVAWRWASVDRPLQKGNPALRRTRQQNTPLMVNGTLYTVTGLGLVAALDPATGQTRWMYDPESYKAGRPNNGGFLQRGVAYWTDGTNGARADRHARRVSHLARRAHRQARSGVRRPMDTADLTAGIRRRARSASNLSARHPLVAGDVVIVGSSDCRRRIAGHIEEDAARLPARLRRADGQAAVDVPHRPHAGRIRLRHVAQRIGRAPRHRERVGRHGVRPGARLRLPADLDAEQRLLRRPSTREQPLRREPVLLEARTGKRVWHFQAVHHGLWDYDFPTNPILGDITLGGRRVRAVIQVSKQAFTYVFDRRTGQPVWPIEERPCRRAR